MKELELLFSHRRHPEFKQVCLAIGCINSIPIELEEITEKIHFLIDLFKSKTPLDAASSVAFFNIDKNPFEGKLNKFPFESAITQQSDLKANEENILRFCLLLAALTSKESKHFARLCLKIRLCLARGDSYNSDDAINNLKEAFESRKRINAVEIEVKKGDSLTECLINIINLITNNGFLINNKFEIGIFYEFNKKINHKTEVIPDKIEKIKYWSNKLVGLNENSPELMTVPELIFVFRLIQKKENTNPGLAFTSIVYSWTGRDLQEILDLQWGVNLFEDHFYIDVSHSVQIAQPINKEGFVNSNNRVRINFPKHLVNLINKTTRNKILTNHPKLRDLTGLEEKNIREFGKDLAKCLRIKFPRIRVTTVFSQAKKHNFMINKDLTLIFIMHQKRYWIENVEYHYCQYSHASINQHFQRLFESLMLGEGSKASTDSSKVVGANGIIKLDHLKEVISGKQKSVKDAVSNCIYEDRKKLKINKYDAQTANELTIYTAFQFFAETGVRPIKTFFTSRTRQITGTNIILLKDKYDVYHKWERPVVLSDSLNANLKKCRNIQRYLSRNLAQDKYVPLFHIIEGKSLRPLKRKDLNEYLHDHKNIIPRLRPTFRTFGIEFDIKIEDLRMQLGHHLSIKNYLGKNSTVGYREWESKTLKFLNEYSKTLGFSNIQFPCHSVLSKIKFKSILRPAITDKRKETEREIKNKIKDIFESKGEIPYAIHESYYLEIKKLLCNGFEKESLCESLLMSKFKALKIKGHKIYFSLKNPPNPEKPTLNYDCAARLEKGLKLQSFLTKKVKNNIKNKDKAAYEWLVMVCFSFGRDFDNRKGTASLSQPTDNELREFCKGVLSPSKTNKRNLLKIAKALAVFYLPGVLLHQLDASNFKNNLEPVVLALKNRCRQKLSVEEIQTVDSNDENLVFNSANEIKKHFLSISKNMEPGKHMRKRRELIHALLRQIDLQKTPFLVKSYTNWLCDRIVNGGVIKDKLKWSYIKQNASIAHHLDRMFCRKDLEKTTQKQFNELLIRYCSSLRGKQLAENKKLIEEFGKFIYKNVIGINEYPRLWNAVGIKNILFQHEFDYLFEALGEHQAADENNYGQRLLLVLGFKFGLRRDEARGLLFSDIQIEHNSKSVNIRYYGTDDRTSKTTNSRRVIKVENLSSALFKVFVELKESEDDSETNKVFEHLCKFDNEITDCFYSLVKKLKIITGDPLFRFHWLRTSRANSILEKTLDCEYNIFYSETENHPRFLGHSSLIITIAEYGVNLTRFYEQFRYSLRGGWSDIQIECLTGLTATNIRKKRSRFNLGKSPTSISKLVPNSHQFKAAKIKHNKIAGSEFESDDKIVKGKSVFKVSLLELLNKRQSLIHTISEKLKNNFLEFRFCEEYITFLDQTVEPNKKDLDRIICHFLNIDYNPLKSKKSLEKLHQLLQPILVQLSKGHNEFELNSNDMDTFSTLMANLHLSDSISTSYTNKKWKIKLTHGFHPLAFPRATKLLFELIYLTIFWEKNQ